MVLVFPLQCQTDVCFSPSRNKFLTGSLVGENGIIPVQDLCGVLLKLYTVSLRPEVKTPCPFVFHFDRNGAPFRIPLFEKRCPFHILSLPAHTVNKSPKKEIFWSFL